MVEFGELREDELLRTSTICAPVRTQAGELPPQRFWPREDRIVACTLRFARSRESGELRSASLWLVASGGKLQEDGGKNVAQYELRLQRPAGSREWTLTRYVVRVPE
jgi:hypothetical protein